MTDTISRSARSRVMRTVHSEKTGPERLLRMALTRERLRGWKLNEALLPGRPDFAFRRPKLAVFVDGCFWHGCLRCYRNPKSNARYWNAKLRMNRARDKRDTKALSELGWRVLRLWEHQVQAVPNQCVGIIRQAIREK